MRKEALRMLSKKVLLFVGDAHAYSCIPVDPQHVLFAERSGMACWPMFAPNPANGNKRYFACTTCCIKACSRHLGRDQSPNCSKGMFNRSCSKAN